MLGAAGLVAACDSREAPMPKSDAPVTQRLTSKDGTRIAYERRGAGRPVVLVDGAFCSRRFGPMDKLAPLLARRFTVLAYDRRGRGESGDTAPYAVDREIEDLEALLEAAGGSACVFGMSSGAALSLEAAARGLPIIKLAVYEPPYFVDPADRPPPADSAARLQALVSAGDRAGAAKYYLKDVIGLPGLMVTALSLMPAWTQMKAAAPSLAHDATLMGDFHLPKERLGRVSTPTLVMSGAKSPALLRKAGDAVAAAVPGARRTVLAGQTHDISAPVAAPVLEAFFRQGGRPADMNRT